MKERPLITIGLPLYKMEKIQWLAIESINRQEIDVPFEVLIDMEFSERDNAFIQSIGSYIRHPRCVSTGSSVRSEWVPLPVKWKDIAKQARGDVFILQAGDCYSDPKRLHRAYRDIIKQGYDWTQDADGWFYHVQYKKLLRFDQKEKGTGLNMAFRTSLGKDLPESDKTKGIDFWLYSNLDTKKTKWNHGENMSVDTHGYNTISYNRSKYFRTPAPPFFKTEKEITDLLPPDIIEGLGVK